MGRTASKPVQTIRHDYSSTSVTTSAYVELDSSLNADASEIEIFDSSGQTLILAQGAASAEADLFHIIPGGNGGVQCVMGLAMRLSVKALSADATSGELIINLWG